MTHDVYLCYGEEDVKLKDAANKLFKENGIKTWIKSRDMSSKDSVDKITNAIADSKCFVLIMSESSQLKNYTITEIDIAFSRSVPIIGYKVDESKIPGNLEFITETQTLIKSYPNSKRQLEELVRKTLKIIGKSADKVKIDSNVVDAFEAVNPKQKENRIKKIIAAAIPIAIVAVLIYLFVIVPTGQNTTDDGVFSMNMTNVEVSNSHYKVYGESYNLPSDSEKYLMNIRFFDENDYMVFEVNSTADEFRHGIIWQGNLPTNNVTHVGFRLFDLNNKVLSNGEYEVMG